VYDEAVRCPGPALLLVVVAVAAASASVADARPGKSGQKSRKKPIAGRKVHIETVPAGASVFVGDKESGPAGTTPIDLTLPYGEQVVILELDGFLPRFETIVVEEGDSTTLTFAYELDSAKATLVVQPDASRAVPRGTKVLIDGVEKGAPPVRAEVEVGAHQVQVTAPGQQAYEEWVEVEGGEEHVMTIPTGGLGVGTTATAERPPHRRRGGPIGTLRTGVEIGFRRFRYDNPQTGNLRPYDANGSAHLVIDAELHPWRRWYPNHVLDRISLIGGAGYSPVIVATDNQGMSVNGYWRSQHAGLRVRALDRSVAVDVDAGWVRTLYTFRDADAALVDDVPDVDYNMLRLGLRMLRKLGAIGEAWAAVDDRIVLSAGALEDRFRAASINGFDVRAGGAAYFMSRHLEARVEAHYTRIGWTFQSQPMDAYRADGGTDSLFGITFTVGGTY